MTAFEGTFLRTVDKQEALNLISRCLDSEQPVNAEVGHLDGMYSVEVSMPTDECADEEG